MQRGSGRSRRLPLSALPQYAFDATPKQQRYAEAVFSGKYRYLYYGGAIRGGKSYGIMAVLFALCQVFPGSRWAIVRKDLPTLRRNVIPIFDKLKPDSFGPIIQGTWTATHENGSQIILFPESHAGDKGYDRWKGLEVNGFWLTEANELQQTSWDWALQRAGSYIIHAHQWNPNPTQPPPLILLDSNPAGNWVKRMFYSPWKKKELKPPFFYLPATIHDNPYLTPEYLASLERLNERDYQVYVMGDWDLLTGQALEELSRDMHLVPDPYRARLKPGQIPNYPEHWLRFGGFDWGYSHPFSFGLYLASEERIFCVDTIRGSGMADAEMVSYILEVSESVGMPATQLQYVVAGKDVDHDVKARAAIGETTAERFQKAGIPMMAGDVSRISGLKNFRELTAWKKVGKARDPKTGKIIVVPGEPRFVWFDTPSNTQAYDQCANMVLDPDRPEDVLKVDAVDGEGGDDDYDQTRYALQSRAKAFPAPADEVDDDTHPGFDYKRKEKKRRTRLVTGPDDQIDDESLRPGFRIPRTPPMGRVRVPRWGGETEERLDDEDDGEL